MAVLALAVIWLTGQIEIGKAVHPERCHPEDVSDTCTKLNAGIESTEVTIGQVRDVLVTSRSSMESLWRELGLSARGNTAGCMTLCKSLMAYIEKVGIMPTRTCRACSTVSGGQTVCDIDVSPQRIAAVTARMNNSTPMEPDEGILDIEAPPGMPPTRPAPETADVERSIWGMVEVLANFFYVYPSSGADLAVTMGDVPEAQFNTLTVQQLIANHNNVAKAWISTVLLQMANCATGPFRAEWFGGSGRMSEMQVRDRILRSINFVSAELQSIRYVYPADQATPAVCTGGIVAYVWKFRSDGPSFQRTTGPRCSNSANPLGQQCALDASRRYFVYLCELWVNVGEEFQISTLVHEAIHHSGPNDVTYDRDEMRRLPVAQQLDNAPSYENFVVSVASFPGPFIPQFQVARPQFQLLSPVVRAQFQLVQTMQSSPVRTALVLTLAVATAAIIAVVLASLGTCSSLDVADQDANKSWIRVGNSRPPCSPCSPCCRSGGSRIWPFAG